MVRVLHSFLFATVCLFAHSASAVTSAPPNATAPIRAYRLCGMDFVGDYITYGRYASPEDCLAPCKATWNCNAATWTDEEGGTCLFKAWSSAFDATPSEKVVSYLYETHDSNIVEPSAVGFHSHYDIPGHDIGNERLPRYGDCEAKCLRNPKCYALTWTDFEGGTCWYKGQASTPVAKKGAVSGTIMRPVGDGVCPGTPAPTPVTPAPSLPAVPMRGYRMCGLAFVGDDLSSGRYASLEDCIAPCKAIGQCDAVTWTDKDGGTCHFKLWPHDAYQPTINTNADSFLHETVATNFVEPSVVAYSFNFDMPGHDIGNARAAIFGECEGRCLRKPNCYAFTYTDYEGGTCWFKGRAGTKVASKGVHSAAVQRPISDSPCMAP